jgi:hypothetical protein
MTDAMLPLESGPVLYKGWRPLVDGDLALLDSGSWTHEDLLRWGVPSPLPEGWEDRLREWGAPYLPEDRPS